MRRALGTVGRSRGVELPLPDGCRLLLASGGATRTVARVVARNRTEHTLEVDLLLNAAGELVVEIDSR